MHQKLITITLAMSLLGLFVYSFLHYSSTPLDGDMGVLIVAEGNAGKVLEDPFGIHTILNDDKHSNPNRFFAQYFFGNYFLTTPFLLQRISTPVDSIYYAAAISKLLMEIGFIYLLTVLILGSNSVFNRKGLLAAMLITPLFQAYAYVNYMDIVGQSITYAFFYALPLLLLLFFYTKLYLSVRNRVPLSGISRLLLISLVVILPLSGPLIPPVILVVDVVLAGFYLSTMKSNWSNLVNYFKNVFLAIPKSLLLYLIPTTILSIYSLFLGAYNIENQTAVLSIGERYARLPIGLFKMLTGKLGLSLLLGFVLMNATLIKHFYLDNRAKEIIAHFKWLAIFAVIYILLLPLGGYREYRPYIVRSDTLMPVTIGLVYLYGASTYFLLGKMKNKFYPVAVIVFSLIFINAGRASLHGNDCEKYALQTIANSNEKIVLLEEDCTVLSWFPIRDYHQSRLNAKLLKIWGVTDEERLYYSK